MRVYFHQRVGDDYIEDPDGHDYPSLEAARAAAIVSARHLWAAAIIAGEDLTGESIEVAAADGRHLFSVPLSEALPAGLGGAAAKPAETGNVAAVVHNAGDGVCRECCARR